MSAENGFASEVTERQVAMFAMFVGPGLFTTRAALAAASKIPDSTLKNWAGGAAMPLHAVLQLRKYLPAAAIDMLTEPAGVRFADIETTDASWDAIAADAAGLVSEVCEARRDGKIDHTEEARLRRRARGLIAELSDAVADG